MAFLSHPEALAAFIASVFLLSFGAVLVAGHFPLPPRGLGRRLVQVDLLLLVLLFATAIALGVVWLSWPAAVIGGGLAVLLAPLAFQALPRAWRDGRPGLLLLLALSVLSILGSLLLLLSGR